MSNVITQSNPQTLAKAEHQRLSAEAEKTISIKEKIDYRKTPIYGENSYIDRWETQAISHGSEIFFKQEPTPELLTYLKHPATDIYIGKALSDLHAHKPYGRGAEAFQVIIRDLAHDLKDLSHWALKKVLETYRKDPTTTFFPNTAQLLQSVKSLDEQIRWHGKARPATPAAKRQSTPQQPWQKPTSEQRLRAAKIMHDAGSHATYMAAAAEWCPHCQKELKELDNNSIGG